MLLISNKRNIYYLTLIREGWQYKFKFLLFLILLIFLEFPFRKGGFYNFQSLKYSSKILCKGLFVLRTVLLMKKMVCAFRILHVWVSWKSTVGLLAWRLFAFHRGWGSWDIAWTNSRFKSWLSSHLMDTVSALQSSRRCWFSNLYSRNDLVQCY